LGKLRRQVKPLREATAPRIIPGVVHLNAKNAREPKTIHWRKEEDSGTNRNTMEAPTNLYEQTISILGPTGHVNLLLDVQVISS
jgi:hypothetical protein